MVGMGKEETSFRTWMFHLSGRRPVDRRRRRWVYNIKCSIRDLVLEGTLTQRATGKVEWRGMICWKIDLRSNNKNLHVIKKKVIN